MSIFRSKRRLAKDVSLNSNVQVGAVRPSQEERSSTNDPSDWNDSKAHGLYAKKCELVFIY